MHKIDPIYVQQVKKKEEQNAKIAVVAMATTK